MANKYGEIALLAAELQSERNPCVAWSRAAERVFPDSLTSQVKGCPKGAFLGLCEVGLIVGIPMGSYTTSKDNKAYAVRAVEILRTGRKFPKPIDLWKAVMNGRIKAHNGQMDVVLSLWNQRLIRQ